LAGLDFYDPEPFIKDGRIVDLPNVFLYSPHISHVDHDWAEMFKLMVDDVERIVAGDEPYFEYTQRTLDNRRGASVSKL
jgi:phosphoglycerate dehydrogenase-like enzyme